MKRKQHVASPVAEIKAASAVNLEYMRPYFKTQPVVDGFVETGARSVPGILMGAVLGASTRDIEAYHNVLSEITSRGIAVEVRHVKEPEVQRIHIEAGKQSAFVDAMNRGGGRLKLVHAQPSLAEAQSAAARLGIKLAEA